MNEFFNIDSSIVEYGESCEKQLLEVYSDIDKVAQHNTYKVMSAFSKNRVSENCFFGSTGYGYGDKGRDVLDAVLAEIFGAEDALIRHSFVSGTHAIAVALFGILRPNDIMVSLSGRPYDTLHGVIGLSEEEGRGSLKDFGIHYRQVDLMENGRMDIEKIKTSVSDAKIAYIQRSRGYSLRPSITIEEIAEVSKIVKEINPNIIVMVDNCYGEFVEKKEPTQVGADIIIGSLIKNPGGGIARTGGYIAGRKDLVELAACRHSTASTGKEVGCTLEESRNMYMGLFFAPTVVAAALKTACLAAKMLQGKGYQVTPLPEEYRTDIIQAVTLGDRERLVAFCQGVQKGAPVDSFVVPEPWDMPGYTSQVIMAAGAFNGGASIELSADAPLREPFAAWLQGGLNYPSGKLGILLAIDSMAQRGLL